MLKFLNPWVIIGMLAVLVGVYMLGHHNGAQDGATRIQQKWDKDTAAKTEAARKDGEVKRKTEQELQIAADTKREEDAKKTQELNARLAAALSELRNRPSRPASSTSVVPTAPGAGTVVGCTGAQLYRDDGELLTRLANTAQRVRNQRDTCYAQYNNARAKLDALIPN
jgi:hypothetical protein